MVHPQCTNVGVGGFLLGGGVNYEGPQTAKFGTGAENVVEYQMVDAYGDIVRVNGNQITRRSFHGGEVRSLLDFFSELFFSLTASLFAISVVVIVGGIAVVTSIVLSTHLGNTGTLGSNSTCTTKTLLLHCSLFMCLLLPFIYCRNLFSLILLTFLS